MKHARCRLGLHVSVQCHRANKSGAHYADERYCTCSDGTALVYDKASIYQPIKRDGGIE